MARILIVEDHELNRDMLSRRLQMQGFEVILAVNGQDGIDKAKASAPDLILMDMSLPIIDGWQATRTLKNDSATAKIPVIGLSAHAMSSDRERGLEVGCDDYETKPIDFKQLMSKISVFINNN